MKVGGVDCIKEEADNVKLEVVVGEDGISNGAGCDGDLMLDEVCGKRDGEGMEAEEVRPSTIALPLGVWEPETDEGAEGTRVNGDVKVEKDCSGREWKEQQTKVRNAREWMRVM